MSPRRYRTARRPGSRQTVLEHRLVMERILGRPLRRDEHVHHRNGDCFDNRPENLEVLSPKEHMAAHQRQKHPLTKRCEVCEKEFTPHPTKRKRARTCSRDCFRALQRIAKQGDRQPNARLTAVLVANARTRVAAGELIVDVAKEFAVSSHTLANAVTGRTWAHLLEPAPCKIGHGHSRMARRVAKERAA